jgi:hypothetical protein
MRISNGTTALDEHRRRMNEAAANQARVDWPGRGLNALSESIGNGSSTWDSSLNFRLQERSLIAP